MTAKDLFDQLIHLDLFELLKHVVIVGVCTCVALVGAFVLFVWILLMIQ